MSKKTNDYNLIKKSMELSLYWAERSKKHLEIILIKLYLELFKEVLFKDLRLKS